MALAASVVAKVFIWERTSSNCAGGKVLSVRDIASGQFRPGGRSTPKGSGGSVDAPAPGGGGAAATPFEGAGC